MPSAGMRRTTRVFGMVKSYDGARVLRSGRRLWQEKSVEEVNKLFEPVKKKNGKTNNKENGWSHNEMNHKTSTSVKKTRPSKPRPPKRKTVKRKAREDESKNSSIVDKKFGIVYTRKRKRVKLEKSELDGGIESIISISSGHREICDSWLSVRDKPFAAVVLSKGFCGFSLFLYTILKYMTRNCLELDELAGVLSSQPISDTYNSVGLQFSWDPCSTTGICKFFGARQSVPLFSLDFSAAPLCFMYMYHFMLLRLGFQQYALVNKLTSNEIMAESEEEDDENEMSDSSEWVPPTSIIIALVAPKVYDSRDRVLTRSQVKATKSVTRSSMDKNGLNSQTIQKRRSSVKSRHPKNPHLLVTHKAKGPSVSDLVSSRRNNIPFPSVVPKYKPPSSIQRSSALNLKNLTPRRGSSNCSANILFIEPDKCYREEGASVKIEKSSSGERFLVIKKNGVTKYTYKPQNNMRPPACNRFTHALMWTVDNSWKLEFPNRDDWHIFKDLYKECADHNLPDTFFRVIPVPWVCEVSGFDDASNVPFHRPDSYISTNGDELSRALAKTTANYDMDSEDEEWLKEFDNDSLTADHFELMVDSFEKDFYYSAEDFNDEMVAPNVGLDFVRREIVEDVYVYWNRKRKQRQSALLKVFQSYKRPSLLPKQPPRRKRSFKRQAIQSGRTKLPSFLLAEGEASEDENAKLKAEEEAECSTEEAIVKRRRAQALLETADLASYKAKMSLRIAEAAQFLGSTDAAVSHFLD